MNALPTTFTRRRFTQLAAITAGTLALGACAREANSAPASSGKMTDSDASLGEQKTEQPSDQQELHSDKAEAPVDPADEMRAAVRARMQEMSLEQKVAQLFVVAPESLAAGVSPVTQAAEVGQAALADYPVGGFIYFAANLIIPGQTTDLLTNMAGYFAQSENVAPFMCVDEEGGQVARIANNDAFGVENVGVASDLGESGDASRAKNAAEYIAGYVRPLGFNAVFAPVADVAHPDVSNIMTARSFSSSAAQVADMVSAEISGFREKGLISCAKHFPGIGAAVGDSHDEAIVIHQTRAELEALDLVPFVSAIDAGVPLIMVGHVGVPEVAGDTTPASLSGALVQNILREELKFEGVVVTDSLSMGAITNYYTPDQAAVSALHAGCDVLLMPESFAQAYQGVLDAIYAGELSEARLDESVFRILWVKQEYFGSL